MQGCLLLQCGVVRVREPRLQRADLLVQFRRLRRRRRLPDVPSSVPGGLDESPEVRCRPHRALPCTARVVRHASAVLRATNRELWAPLGRSFGLTMEFTPSSLISAAKLMLRTRQSSSSASSVRTCGNVRPNARNVRTRETFE